MSSGSRKSTKSSAASNCEQMGRRGEHQASARRGKLTVPSASPRLLDSGNLSRKYARFAGAVQIRGGDAHRVPASNFVMGTGKINGRMVVVVAMISAVRGGAADASIGNRWIRGADRARSAHPDHQAGRRHRRRWQRAQFRNYEAHLCAEMGSFDVIVKVMGEVRSSRDAWARCGHRRGARGGFAFLGDDSRHQSAFVAARRSSNGDRRGPHQGRTRRLGDSCARQRTVDNEVETEDEAFAQMRRYLSYFPQSVWQVPPYAKPDDKPDRREEELLSIIPRNRRQGYDTRHMLELILDRDSFSRDGAVFGPSLITGFARIDGFPVGVMANDPYFIAGSLDAEGPTRWSSSWTSATRSICRCELRRSAGLPDWARSRDARHHSSWSARALRGFPGDHAMGSDHVRKAFGVAGAGHGNTAKVNLRYAWPSADWGSLPIEGGIEAPTSATSRHRPIRRSCGARSKRGSTRRARPIRTAEAFDIKEIIDPRDTRPLLCEWVHSSVRIIPTQLGPRIG